MTTRRLARYWEHARTVPGLGRDVSALIALIVVGFLVAGVILAKQRVHWPWQNELTFSADFRQVPGISPGNGQEVRIAGVTVGRITEASVGSRGQARLTLAIEPEYHVYKDARLVLRPKTPLNDMYVEMSQGSTAAGEVREGDTIPVSQTANPVQMDEVLQHLDDRTRNALSSLLGEADAALVNAPNTLPVGLQGASTTLRTFGPVVKSLQTRRETIAKLVHSLGVIASVTGADDDRTRRLISTLDKTLGTMAQHDADVRAALNELPGVTKSLADATSSVSDLSGQLDPTLANLKAASGALPGALRNLGNFAGRLRTTARSAAPVVADLRPVAHDLRPFVDGLRPAVSDVKGFSGRLDYTTRMLVSYLTHLRGFVYNTASIVELQDASGGILRGQLQLGAQTLGLLTQRSQ